jgi:hypothetical protein
VLLPVERLLIRVRQVPSRADELIALRSRLRAQRAQTPGAEERALALEMRRLKTEVAATVGDVAACSTCATGKREPRGTYAGGDCCAGITSDLFDDDQLAAIAQGGTRPRDLTPPREAHAGCAFRGPTGCTLDTADRPPRCVHYTCMTLRKELRARGDLAAIDRVLDKLAVTMKRFAQLRATRLDDELFATLENALSK